MKTIDGDTPQVKMPDERFCEPVEFTIKKKINSQLREWSEGRRCVRCRHYSKMGFDSCIGACAFLCKTFAYQDKTINPETFSCSGFQCTDEK